MDSQRAVGVAAGPNGEPPREIRAQMVVDATGRSCLLSRKLGWRKPDVALNKISHYAHFTGVQRKLNGDPQFPDSTMTDIHTTEGGWIWYIPLANDVVSVGAVLDAKYASDVKGPQARFDLAVEGSATIKEWMAGGKQITEMHTISNISYLNDCFVGDGFAMIGDASMFVDPVFSAGVTIAIRGGIFAAECIHDGLVHGDLSAARLRAYEEKIRVPMGRIFKMIRNWYSILEKKDLSNNIFTRSRHVPLLRQRLIVLLSGGYDKVDLDAILAAAGEGDQVAARS
jgi:halogenation protein CepH